MGYLAVSSRQIGDVAYAFEYAVVNEGGVTVTDKWDKEIIGPFHANGIQICNNKKIGYLLTDLSEIDIEVYVTASRVIIRCDKYDKGNRKWSGSLTALALNAVERGIGRARSKGKVLIGHIRYEWLGRILYENKTGFFMFNNMVRLDYQDEDEYPVKMLKLKFKKDTDTEKLANLILHRLCLYRSSMTDEKDDEEREFFSRYSQPENVFGKIADSREYANIVIPGSYIAPGAEEFRPAYFLGGVVQDEDNVAPIQSNENVVNDSSAHLADESDETKSDDMTVTLDLKAQKLMTLISKNTGIEIPLNNDKCIIGRSKGKCDVVVGEPSVSNTHAFIECVDNCYYIKDLDSSNHTYVNGTRIDSTPVQLADGDSIRLAKEEFRVVIKG